MEEAMLKSDLLEKIETYILDTAKPGDRLPPEEELAKHFGVSRGTLREIIGYLVLKGILERRTSRGTILRIPDVQDIAKDLTFQLKLLNCGKQELKAGREMLEQCIVPGLIRYATPAQIDRLTAINEAMMESARDTAEADKYDLEFHMTLFEITGNRILRIFAHILTVQFEGNLRPPFADENAVRISGESHRKIIQAIADRDGAELSRLLGEHIKPLPVS